MSMKKPNGNTKHGMSKTKIYGRWMNVLYRCYNVKGNRYKYYGGRGIKVCKRWHDFRNFYKDMGQPPEGLSLDRIDNNKGYSKENCRWATMAEQSKNKRSKLRHNKNIYKHKSGYVVQFKENKVDIYVGVYKLFKHAKQVRDDYNLKR